MLRVPYRQPTFVAVPRFRHPEPVLVPREPSADCRLFVKLFGVPLLHLGRLVQKGKQALRPRAPTDEENACVELRSRVHVFGNDEVPVASLGNKSFDSSAMVEHHCIPVYPPFGCFFGVVFFGVSFKNDVSSEWHTSA